MSKTVRRGAAVFSNSQLTLQIVEVNVLAEQEKAGWRYDEPAAEEQGFRRLRERSSDTSWSYVGTLFAECGGLSRGRIDWAKDFERIEVLA